MEFVFDDKILNCQDENILLDEFQKMYNEQKYVQCVLYIEKKLSAFSSKFYDVMIIYLYSLIKAKNKEKALKKVKGFFEGKYKPNAWVYCDGILTHVKRKKKVGKFTYYVGKIPTVNVIYDGTHYAHCESLKEGILDLEFKNAKDRGSERYEKLTKESVLTYDEAVIAYRVITGACSAGTRRFLNGLNAVKEKYTVAEIIEITKGQYGSATFKNFFEKK